MGKKLYVGNLSYDVSDADLEQLFSAHGTVQSAQVIQDRTTGRSKGFGFVEMDSDQEAQPGRKAAAVLPAALSHPCSVEKNIFCHKGHKGRGRRTTSSTLS